MKKRVLQRFVLILILAATMSFLMNATELMPMVGVEGIQKDFVSLTMGENGVIKKVLIILVEMVSYSLEG
jgi:hypothetical protein